MDLDFGEIRPLRPAPRIPKTRDESPAKAAPLQQFYLPHLARGPACPRRAAASMQPINEINRTAVFADAQRQRGIVIPACIGHDQKVRVE